MIRKSNQTLFACLRVLVMSILKSHNADWMRLARVSVLRLVIDRVVQEFLSERLGLRSPQKNEIPSSQNSKMTDYDKLQPVRRQVVSW